ncbi:MAG: glycoside hydrolase family 30 beta sandwich domain-containing protein [Paludibacter sp.]
MKFHLAKIYKLLNKLILKLFSAKNIGVISVIFFTELAVCQVVTPWITSGDKTKLLQQQSTVSFTPNSNTVGNVLTINAATTYQSIDGFGFCLTEGSAEVISSLAEAQQNALLTELFDKNTGLGISMLRISIGASDLSSSNYSYNETSGDVSMTNFSLAGPDLTYLLPILKKALTINPDIKILATTWSPPRWMKSNNSWIGGTLNTSAYTAYANYFVKYIAAMKLQGVTIWGITVQNEPENPNNNPSMSMNSTEQKNFINSNLGPAMATAGYSAVKIIAFDHNCDNTAYPIDVCNNSSYVDGAAFHLYAGSISAMSTVKNATNKNVYFTEQYTGSGGSFSGDLGWHLQNVVIGATNNWAKAVLEWNLANNNSIGPYTPGGCNTCLGAITITNSTTFTRNVSYYIIGQVAKFVKPGAVRIGVSSTSSSLVSAAFTNTDASVALITYNMSATPQSIKILNGSNSFSYTIPALSACSFVWNNNTQDNKKLSDELHRMSISYNRILDNIIVKFPIVKKSSLSLVSFNGLVIFSHEISEISEKTIQTNALPSGLYFVRLFDGVSSVFARFIKF